VVVFGSLSLSAHAPLPAHIHTLSLPDALPISVASWVLPALIGLGGVALAWSQIDATERDKWVGGGSGSLLRSRTALLRLAGGVRSEEHTSELQSRENLVCRLLLENKEVRARRA